MYEDLSVARNEIVAGEGDKASNFKRASSLPEPYEQILRAYQNRTSKLGSSISSKTLDFEELKKEDLTFRLSSKGYYTEENVPLTPYDVAVSNLRKGDTLIFKDKTFILGSFLGAGNATNIFEIKGEPRFVIRIPFSTLSASRAYTAKERIKLFVNGEPKLTVDRVKVEYVGYDLDYILVTKIDGDQNGADFLRTIPFSTEGIAYYFASLSFSQKLIFKGAGYLIRNSPMRKKYFKLLKALENYSQDPRQYIWDTTKSQWILADWE